VEQLGHDNGPEADGPEMTFDVTADDGTALVTVRGELDISNVGRLEAAAAPVLQSNPTRLVVNLRDLQFADSSAIAVWVGWAAVVGEIELRDASPLLRQVITKMGLAETLRLMA
jgi:anti-anti-sigma factor